MLLISASLMSTTADVIFVASSGVKARTFRSTMPPGKPMETLDTPSQ
jgi:hypothetical protein